MVERKPACCACETSPRHLRSDAGRASCMHNRSTRGRSPQTDRRIYPLAKLAKHHQRKTSLRHGTKLAPHMGYAVNVRRADKLRKQNSANPRKKHPLPSGPCGKKHKGLLYKGCCELYEWELYKGMLRDACCYKSLINVGVKCGRCYN